MAKKTYIAAITEALDLALEKDKDTLVFGEDVGQNGGVFCATDGLQAKYGEARVFNTPLAESGIGGLAIGLATQGFKPIMEIQFGTFIFEAFDSVAGQMSRTRYRFNGTRSNNIVLRTPYGIGTKTPEMHADSIEGLLSQIPGLRVVMPSNPADAKGLLLASIENNDPVMFLENLHLYRSMKGEVPEGYYITPLDQAAVAKEGTDVSIIAYGGTVPLALKAAETLEKEGIHAEVLDLRTVAPLDVEAIGATVKKTGRVVVVQEAQRTAGIAANVMAEIGERFVLDLEAPIGRVSGPDSIFPFSQAENDWMIKDSDIVAKVKEVVNYD